MLTIKFGGDIPNYRRLVDRFSLHLDPDGGMGNLQITKAGSRRPEPLVFRGSEDILMRAAVIADHAMRAGQVPMVEYCDIPFQGMRFFHDPEFDQFVIEGQDGATLVATPVLPEALRGGAGILRAMAQGETFEPIIGPAPGR